MELRETTYKNIQSSSCFKLGNSKGIVDKIRENKEQWRWDS